MSFASVRIAIGHLDGLVAFYEQVTSQQAERAAPLFARFSGPGGNIAIASTATVAMLGDAFVSATSRPVFVEFEAIDVDGVFAELDPKAEDVVLEPPTVSRG